MNPLRFTRRNLLRGGLAATATIPLLDARMAAGQTATYPTRLVVFATPNGTRNSLFWPTGTETNFTLNTFTPDLAPFKSKLTFLKGIKLNPALQNGMLGGTVGSEHARGTGGMLTGRPLKSGTQFKSFGNTTSGWGSGQSLDQYLVGKLQPNTTFPSLQVGVHVRDTEVRARISYAGADMPIPPREDPKDVFSVLFGMSSGGTGTDPALARLWAQRKSVFDANNAETERIKGLVGKKPMFGICLGHQLLALALGARTFKLKFGHRGLNQPVKDLTTGRVEITTQNHGFAVDVPSIAGIAKSTHLHLNDGTSEGLEAPDARAFSVQYHPEAAAGPHDALYLFDRFVRSMQA